MLLQEHEIKETGISQYGVIPSSDITFEEGIREICKGNACRLYGTTWACPPAVGTVEQCRERCLQYQKAMVFQAVYPLTDSFDFEGMMQGHASFKKLCDQLYLLVKAQTSSFLLLSNEGCNRCETCTYPESPCRMPERLFPSLEGYGINVARLAAKAGVRYHNGENTVTYFGMLLYDEHPQNHP